jgi:hypothetical protein
LAKNQIFIAQGFKKYKNKKWVELLLKVKMNEKGKKVYPLLLGGEMSFRNGTRSH